MTCSIDMAQSPLHGGNVQIYRRYTNALQSHLSFCVAFVTRWHRKTSDAGFTCGLDAIASELGRESQGRLSNELEAVAADPRTYGAVAPADIAACLNQVPDRARRRSKHALRRMDGTEKAREI